MSIDGVIMRVRSVVRKKAVQSAEVWKQDVRWEMRWVSMLNGGIDEGDAIGGGDGAGNSARS